MEYKFTNKEVKKHINNIAELAKQGLELDRNDITSKNRNLVQIHAIATTLYNMMNE